MRVAWARALGGARQLRIDEVNIQRVGATGGRTGAAFSAFARAADGGPPPGTIEALDEYSTRSVDGVRRCPVGRSNGRACWSTPRASRGASTFCCSARPCDFG